ncbi:MAG: TonB-dependent receptor [Pseudomonadota bacterium]
MPGVIRILSPVWLGALVALPFALALPVQADDAAADTFEFDIAVQPLAEALVEFGDTTRRQVAADSDAIRGVTSSPVSGRMTAQAALVQMVSGTTLELVTVNGGSYALRSSKASGSDSAAPQQIEELIVTGTKRNLSLQRTQTSVALVTAEDIEEQVLFSVEDILLRTANVSTDAAGALNNLSIRGITLSGVGFAGTGATANVYVDGSPNSFNANQGAANLWDVAQVEILRGPQSTVQGRNALAGAIIINTADPEYDFGADLRVLAGNENNRQYSGMLNLPLIDNRLAFRFSADYREIDFEILNVDTGNNTRFQEALTARAKLLWQPTDLLRLELGYQYIDTEFGEFNQVIAPGPAGTDEFAAFDLFGSVTYGLRERFEFNEVSRFGLDLNYTISDAWTLYGVATYEESQRDTDFGALGEGDAPDDTYQLELRAAFDYGRLTGWIGAYYFETEGSFRSVFSFPTAVFGIPSIPADGVVVFDTFQEDSTENRALFADVTYELNAKWSLNVGARYDREDFSDTGLTGTTVSNPPDCIFDPAVPNIGGLPCTLLFPPPTDAPTLADFSAFLPRGAVIYNFDELRSLSFTIARGYRAGGSYIRSIPGESVQLLDFDPEFLTNYEFAFRSRWPDQALTLNANLFFSDWEDQQVTVPGPSGTALDTLILNAGSAEIYGLELELRKALSGSLDLFATLGLVETEFQDFPFAVDANGNPVNPANPTYANLAGNEFNSAPRTTLAVGLSYERSNGFFMSGNASYASSQFSDVTNIEENKVGDYTLVNLRAGYRRDTWTIAGFVDNVFDERFVGRQGLSSVNTSSGVAVPNAQPFFVVNDPRVYGLEIRYSY